MFWYFNKVLFDYFYKYEFVAKKIENESKEKTMTNQLLLSMWTAFSMVNLC